jgi:outer membrane protein, multidrug efflux system
VNLGRYGLGVRALRLRSCCSWRIALSHLAAPMFAAVLAACSAPADLANIHDDLARHRQSLPADEVGRPLTEDDAVALALRYNLDSRVKALETTLAAGKADLSMFTLLPQMAATGGVTRRNSQNLTTSKDMNTGVTSTDSSLGEDSFRRTGDLTASWNMVDFGIALLRSDQEDDHVVQALEKRRRALHLLVQDVQAAYWKAVINEFAEQKYNALEIRLMRSVQSAEGAERSKVGDPMQMLAHQRVIVETMRQVAELQRQTQSARAELAGLMGMSSSTSFRLMDLGSESGLIVAEPAKSMDLMEEIALANRPELRGEAAQFRIDVADVHAEMLKTLPGIGPYIGGHYDSNSFLVFNSWADAGLKVAWNLVDLMSAPKRIDHSKAVAETTRVRRVAVAMAVLTQVHTADIQYRHALKEYRLTEQMAAIDRRITGLAGKSREAGSGTPMEEIKAEAGQMLSTLRRFLLYSDLQGAKARLNAAMGLDPAPLLRQDDHADVADGQS